MQCHICRYANLTDLGFLSTPGFIAGVTNPMFKNKREWWDVLCDISTGEVLLSAPAEKDEFDGADRNFVLEVLDGVNAGYDEEWIRCMFEEYTRKVCQNSWSARHHQLTDVHAHLVLFARRMWSTSP